VTENDMVTRLNEVLENKKEKVVFIRADEEVEYSAVMTAMDQLRNAGVEDIGLITERKKTAEGAGGR
jgi:biopolymer transport protein TolR